MFSIVGWIVLLWSSADWVVMLGRRKMVVIDTYVDWACSRTASSCSSRVVAAITRVVDDRLFVMDEGSPLKTFVYV